MPKVQQQQETVVTEPQNGETRPTQTVGTSYPHAQGTIYREDNREVKENPTTLQGSLTVEQRAATVAALAEESLQRQQRRAHLLDNREASREVAREIAQALLQRGGRELWADFNEITREGTTVTRWNRWLRQQVYPHFKRLGVERFMSALGEGVIAASRPDIRSPAAVIVRVLEEAKPEHAPTGGNGHKRQLDLDELLGTDELEA